MAPPPNPGDATNKNDDDPLGGMDPMAWLESLAARQGANPEELITAHNLEIPVPPADAVDEPGYTPGYDTGKPTAPEPAKAETPEPAKAEPLKPAEPVAAPPAPEPVASTAASDDLLGGMDPMKWLESLAARQGAKPEELITAHNLEIPVPPADAVIDEPGYVDYDPFGSGAARAEAAKAEAKAETPEVEAPKIEMPKPAEPAKAPTPEPVASVAPGGPTGGVDDVLGGMDPLAWLESLAARQGANPEELVTGGKLKLPPAPTEEKAEEKPPVEVEAEPAAPTMSVEEATEILGVGEMAGTPAGTDDLLGGMDPLAWLESLAARQGANPEELVTGGKLELPPEPAAAAEPDLSPFAATGVTGGTMEPESALSWLEELAKDQAASVEGVSFDFAESGTVEMATPTGPGDAGGASPDIHEVQEWLNEQARNLELTRAALEAEETSEELPPAEAAELPSWLLESVSQAPPVAPATPPLSEDIAAPVAPGDLPSWLVEPEPEATLDFDTGFLESLAAAAPAAAEPAQPPVEQPVPSGELEALTRPSSPEEVDSWAEALDEEYERRRAGDDSVPEWYLEALARAESEVQSRPEPLSEMPTERVQDLPTEIIRPRPERAAETPAVEPAASAEPVMPDWLREVTEPEAPEPVQGEIPSWMRTLAPSAPSEPVTPAEPVTASVTSMDWLADLAEETELPDWLRPSAPAPASAPEPEPAQAAAPVASEPVAAQPAPPPAVPPKPVEQPAPVAAAPAPAPTVPQAAPVEHGERLKQARELIASSQYSASLQHYQALIDASQLLEETRGDLRQLVDQNPKEPRLRRMLGDTHMRLGDLQAALDTYRSALDQL